MALREPTIPPAEYPITPTSLRSSSSPAPTLPATPPREPRQLRYCHSLSYVTPPPPPVLFPTLVPEPAPQPVPGPTLQPAASPAIPPAPAAKPTAPSPAIPPVPAAKPAPQPWESPAIPAALQAFFATFDSHAGIDFVRLAGALARLGFDDDWALGAIAAHPAPGVWEEARDELDAALPNFAFAVFVRALRTRAERDAAAGVRWDGL